MERPGYRAIGTAAEELDTPGVVIDLASLRHNLHTVHGFFMGRPAKLRPHMKAHLCPSLGLMQLAAGGTMGGVCVAKVGQAEVLSQHGFKDILVASEVVMKSKIARLCALAKTIKISVPVDSEENVRDLSEAAVSAGATLDVLVDIDCRLGRCGVPPGKEAVSLAKVVVKSRGLRFAGLMGYEGCVLHKDFADTEKEVRSAIQRVLDTRQMVEREGMEVGVVSVGGTHGYEVAGSMEGVTEVQAGSYALMDNFYRSYRPQLKMALKVLGTVISHPEPSVSVVDVGQKGIGADEGLPMLEGIKGASVKRCSAEHGIIGIEGRDDGRLDLGRKVWLTPHDSEICMNLYDYVNVVEDGRLVGVWEVSARGRYD
ncbi:MAG: DSD1 family PLP-dependent enzyme [SAR202 cluster bacterium]|nr:DSD1 family PLP-dependent enzyme [SAR202 cluster bacterium]